MDPVEQIEEGIGKIKFEHGLFISVNEGPIKEVYKITRKIGSGAYGEVRK